MFSILATVAYLAALALPILLLRYFGAAHWSWHVLAILAALGLGMMPSPGSLKGPAVDLVFGFLFVFLVTWGIGGIVAFRTHGHRHRHA
jgi:hypothetical protein